MKIIQFLFIFFLKIEYKSIYIFGYVWPNIVIKALQETYNTLLYVVADVTIKSNWSSLKKLANASGNNDYENDNFQ